MKNIRVGNLSSGTTPETIRSLCEPFGIAQIQIDDGQENWPLVAFDLIDDRGQLAFRLAT